MNTALLKGLSKSLLCRSDKFKFNDTLHTKKESVKKRSISLY